MSMVSNPVACKVIAALARHPSNRSTIVRSYLKADPRISDSEIAEVSELSPCTVAKLREAVTGVPRRRRRASARPAVSVMKPPAPSATQADVDRPSPNGNGLGFVSPELRARYEEVKLLRR